jgi:hypothetical protein
MKNPGPTEKEEDVGTFEKKAREMFPCQGYLCVNQDSKRSHVCPNCVAAKNVTTALRDAVEAETQRCAGILEFYNHLGMANAIREKVGR